MTHWWQLPLIAAILVAIWIASMLTEALEQDRGWSWLRSRALGFVAILGLFALLDRAAPAWGEGRRLVAVLVSYLLLAIGEVAHEHHHGGKRLISLPKKS